MADASANQRVELVLQSFQLRAIGLSRQIGDDQQLISLLLMVDQLAVLPAAPGEGDQRSQQASGNADDVEILLERIEQALVAAVEVGGQSRMDGQDRAGVVRGGGFDLGGGGLDGGELFLGVDDGAADQAGNHVEHGFGNDQAVGHRQRRHGVVGDRRPALEGALGHVDQFEAGKPLDDGVGLIERHQRRGGSGRPEDRRRHRDGVAGADRPDRDRRRSLLAPQGRADLGGGQNSRFTLAGATSK